MQNESLGFSTARMVELGSDESLALLASVPMGRIGFTYQALPVIRPVNHLVDGDDIVIRTHTGAALLSSTSVAEVVVYEADHLDQQTRTGWSVMVTGRATRITDPLEVARYQEHLIPWVDMDMDMVIRVSAEIVTGYRLEH
ncbi:pyridoxamine 5'-phosphate oxidase family protein [Streptomyces phaeochromogenes]